MKAYLVCLIALLLKVPSSASGQTVENYADSTTTGQHYRFSFSGWIPQGGYGLIIGAHGGSGGDEGTPHREVYEFGVAKSYLIRTSEGTGYAEEYLSFEVNRITDHTLYGFVCGAHVKPIFLDLGVALNYMTDFSGLRALCFRPYVGFTLFAAGCNLDVIYETDATLLKPNFDIVDHAMVGVRMGLGFLRDERSDGARQAK